MRHLPIHRLAAVALAGTLALAACGSDAESTDAAADTAAAAAPAGVVAAGTVLSPDEGAALLAERAGEITVIDVRTPEEFAGGHLVGAENLDVQAAAFADQIAALDPAAPYVVYCRSGNRSAVAAAMMVAAGFTEVYDLGGLQALADAGYEIES